MDYRNQTAGMALGYAAQGNDSIMAKQQAYEAQTARDIAPPKQTDLDQIGNRIAASINDAALLCDLLSQMEDKLFGPVPAAPGGASNGQIAQGGSIALANAGLDLLVDRLQRAQQIASRLRNAI